MAISYFCDHCGAENAPDETACCACQQPLTQHADLLDANTLLNERYEVLSEIGAGGFGAVYQARDTQKSNQLVAVKQINLKGLSSQEIIEATDAFNREAEILSTLSHPLLPRIFDRFSDPEHWYLVMTFIDGSTLDEYLQQHMVSSLPASAGLPLSDTLAIALQLCDALHYLHKQQPPVIFRDLKPGNIMRTRGGRLYLIDFGIARRFKPGQAKDTIPFGSPGFAAPEQYGRAQTTPQADIYSLGALLSCLISGDDPSEHPFEFPPLRHNGIAGMHELDVLIRRMVALDATKRPADILAVQTELQHIQKIHDQANKWGPIWTPPPGQTPPPSSGGQQQIFLSPSGTQNQTPARKTTRRAVLTVGLIVGGVALIEGIATWGVWHPAQMVSSSMNPANWNQQPTTDTQTQTPTDQISNVFQNNPTFWSPDLSHAAVINAGNNSIEFYLNQGQKPFGAIQPASFGPNLSVQWSPDNQQIIISSDDENGEVWDIYTQSKLFTLPASITGSPIVAWSPNGKYLATTYRDQSNAWILNLLIAQNGASMWKQTITQQTVTCLGWSPNSHYFIFPKINNSSWTLEIWDSQTLQKVQTVSEANNPDFYAGSAVLVVSWSPFNDQIAFILQTGNSMGLWLSHLGNLTGTAAPQQVSNLDNYFSFGGSLAWSPNEKYMAALMNENLYVWNIAGGQTIFTTDNGGNGNLAAFTWSADSRSITTVDNNNVLSQWSIG